MTTCSVMSVFPCLLHNSAVRSSASVPFFLILKYSFVISFVWRLQNEINTTPDWGRAFSAVDLGQAIGHLMHGNLLGLQVRAVRLLMVLRTR